MNTVPAISLLVFFGISIASYLIWKSNLWLRVRTSQEQKRKEWIEDILKQLFHVEQSGRKASLDGLAGALKLPHSKLIKYIDVMSSKELISLNDDMIRLTEDGKQYALEIIRVHRLWEKYLSERTGFDKTEWHDRAEMMEHNLDKNQADQLYQNLGSPRFDPHGDPIPTSTGEMVQPDWKPLSGTSVGTIQKIVHIEDEPDVIYRQIIDKNLRKGQLLKVYESSDKNIVFESEGHSYKLSPIIASNINVKEVTDADQNETKAVRLTSLKVNEKAKIVGLSQECRGATRRRLLDLGFIKGSTVEIGLPGPVKEPKAYLIRNTLIALRNDQADLILIEKE